MQTELSKDILRTIIYYDLLDFSLTSFEVWKHLIGEKECSLGEVVSALGSAELKSRIEEYYGFYFLPGRKDLVSRRIQGDKDSIEKIKIARRIARWLKFVPFFRMAAVTGTLAMRNCEKDSDIDFLVVLEEGRIFTGRLLVTATVHILGRRRYGKMIRNRICLNYYITTGNLKIKRQDLFAANEYSFMYPVYGFDIFQKLSEKNSEWIKKFKPNLNLNLESFPGSSFRKSQIQTVLEALIKFFEGDRIETWLKKKQIARIKRNPLTKKEGAYIEAADENLIFLPDPQGPKIEEKYRALTEKEYFL